MTKNIITLSLTYFRNEQNLSKSEESLLYFIKTFAVNFNYKSIAQINIYLFYRLSEQS